MICATYWDSNFLEVLEVTALILGYMLASPNIVKKISPSFIITSKLFKMLWHIYVQNGLVSDNSAAFLNSD